MGLIPNKTPRYLIRPLRENDRRMILAHLSGLPAADRYGRFARSMSHRDLLEYVEGVDLVGDITAASFADDSALSGFLHLAVSGRIADLGMSVHRLFRHQGLARLMFRYAINDAEKLGVRRVQLATGHPAALRIAEGLGYRWQHHAHGPRASIILPALEFRMERLVCG